jgi:septal ring factor EnvC (AmiA/AmiB activator)
MTTMTATVQQLADTVDEIAEQNKRQDAEIARSLEQRSAHDSCLFALVDVAKQNGHNGAVTEAHKEMMAYLKKEAHTPVYSG